MVSFFVSKMFLVKNFCLLSVKQSLSSEYYDKRFKTFVSVDLCGLKVHCFVNCVPGFKKFEVV